MFLCSVFTGEYTNGHPSYIHPPLKDGENNVFYDSCVNDLNNPSTFVVFEKHQVYPAYLIQYEQRAGTSPRPDSLNQFPSSTQARFSDPSVSRLFFPQCFMPQFQYTPPTFVPITTLPIAPRFLYRPVMRSPFFAHSKQAFFQAGAARFPFPHYHRPPLVRQFTANNPTRPPKRPGSYGRFRSVNSPANVSAQPRTAAPFRKDSAKQPGPKPVRSARDSHPMPLPTTLPSISKESKSVKAHDARQKTSRPADGLHPVNSSESVSSGPKTSKSDKAQNARHQGSNSTKSSSGLRQGTAAGTSARTDASQSGKNENTRAKSGSSLSSRPRNSSDTQSTKPAGKSFRSSDTQSTKPPGKGATSSGSQSTKPGGKSTTGSASQSTKPAGKNAKRH